MIIPKDSGINVKTLNIEEAKNPAISGLMKQLIVKPVVIEPQVKEGKKDKKIAKLSAQLAAWSVATDGFHITDNSLSFQGPVINRLCSFSETPWNNDEVCVYEDDVSWTNIQAIDDQMNEWTQMRLPTLNIYILPLC